MMFGKYFIAF